MIITHLWYGYVPVWVFLFILPAGGLASLLSEPLHQWITFVAVYTGLAVWAFLKVDRDGYWGVDRGNIYRGLRLRPYIRIEEIQNVQIGMPSEWDIGVAAPGWLRLNGGAEVRRLQEQALLLRLTGDRWLVWGLHRMTGAEEFVRTVVRWAPNEMRFKIPPHALRLVTMRNLNRIIQA